MSDEDSISSLTTFNDETSTDNNTNTFTGHNSTSEIPHSISADTFRSPSQTGETHVRGTFVGVFCPSFVNIINIVYYARLPFVIGEAGGKLTIIGLSISFLLVLITMFSLAAISTNGEIEAGGSYYIISRTIGPSIGGTAGFCLAIASILGAASAHIGFAETVVSLYSPKSLLPSQIWDVRVIASIMTIIVAFFTKFGMQIRMLTFFRGYYRSYCLFIRSYLSRSHKSKRYY